MRCGACDANATSYSVAMRALCGCVRKPHLTAYLLGKSMASPADAREAESRNFLGRAAELRALAARSGSAGARKLCLLLAESYERLAGYPSGGAAPSSGQGEM